MLTDMNQEHNETSDMTPTKEQCVQWARECEASVAEIQVGQAWLPWKISFRPDQLHAFALKVLAEKELEVLKLREALNYIGAITPDGGGVNMVVDKALSTPPSTKHLDEYVAARMAESEAKTCKWTPWGEDYGGAYHTGCGNDWGFVDGDISDNKAKFCPYCGRKIDAAIEAEKVRG